MAQCPFLGTLQLGHTIAVDGGLLQCFLVTVFHLELLLATGACLHLHVSLCCSSVSAARDDLMNID